MYIYNPFLFYGIVVSAMRTQILKRRYDDRDIGRTPRSARVTAHRCAACAPAIPAFTGSNANARETRSALATRSRSPTANPTTKPSRSVAAMAHANVACATATNDRAIRRKCSTASTASATISLANAAAARYKKIQCEKIIENLVSKERPKNLNKLLNVSARE